MTLLTKEQALLYLARLLVWFGDNADIIKAGNLGKRAGFDDCAMSNIIHGKRTPRPQSIARLVDEASKYGFDRNKE
jgi:hypothetical protein